jgi:hypothetical protein
LRTFKAPDVPDDLAAVLGFLRRLTSQIEESANRADHFAELQILHEEPRRVRAGMLALADGADWQPDGVNGEGLYRRNAANDAWVFIG